MLTIKKLHSGCAALAQIEPVFKTVLDTFGYPPLWQRENSFACLLKIILEQQVSLSSAQATFDKLLNNSKEIEPRSFLEFDDDALKSFGFSRQKTRYCRILAQELNSGKLDLIQLSNLDDYKVKQRLMQLTGIGHWTADIYLLMILLREDIWPNGDRALAVAAWELLQLNSIPDYPTLAKIAEKWQPYRAIAARILWHFYLNTPRKKQPKKH